MTNIISLKDKFENRIMSCINRDVETGERKLKEIKGRGLDYKFAVFELVPAMINKQIYGVIFHPIEHMKKGIGYCKNNFSYKK